MPLIGVKIKWIILLKIKTQISQPSPYTKISLKIKVVKEGKKHYFLMKNQSKITKSKILFPLNCNYKCSRKKWDPLMNILIIEKKSENI
jgi:hypothetical protein